MITLASRPTVGAETNSGSSDEVVVALAMTTTSSIKLPTVPEYGVIELNQSAVVFDAEVKVPLKNDHAPVV